MKSRLLLAIIGAATAVLLLSAAVAAQASQVEGPDQITSSIKPCSWEINSIGIQRPPEHMNIAGSTSTVDSTIFLPLAIYNHKPFLLYFDDFSDPNSGWHTGDTGNANLSYIDEEYQIIIWKDHDGLMVTPDLVLPADYRIEVDAYQASTIDCSYGLMFGNQYNVNNYEGYQVIIFPASQVFLLNKRNMDGTWTTLVDWTHSSSIMPGTAPNHLRVDRIGSDIIIYINGTQVVTYDDSSFTGPGRDAGVRVYSSDDYPAYGRFDNFGVYRIP
jgi:hypothetical protein